MPIEPADLVEALRVHCVLTPTQLEDVSRDLQQRFPAAQPLAGNLVQRNWLTAYQANLLLQGRGAELVLGPYLLIERLGEGGMGQVFKARHLLMKRVVAIKVIRKDRLTNPEVVQRFYREVEALAQLNHPNLVIAHDAAEINGTHFLVMEYVEGMDLARLLKQRGPLPIAFACEYARQAALGLQHAHERGMVHRDVKPGNLLVTPQGVVKLLDLGLALLGPTGAEQVTELTQEGAVMGTPDYIAPEQALESHTVDIRADIYSLGSTLYALLSGQAPFPGGSLTQKLLRHQRDEPKPVTSLRSEVPAGLAAVLHKMMAKQPEDRYAVPAAIADALVPFCPVTGAVPAEAVAGQASARRSTISVAREPASAPVTDWNQPVLSSNAEDWDLQVEATVHGGCDGFLDVKYEDDWDLQVEATVPPSPNPQSGAQGGTAPTGRIDGQHAALPGRKQPSPGARTHFWRALAGGAVLGAAVLLLLLLGSAGGNRPGPTSPTSGPLPPVPTPHANRSDEPSLDANPLQKVLSDLASKIKTAIEKEGEKEVAVGELTGPAGFNTNGGPGICQELGYALKNVGVPVVQQAKLSLRGSYRHVPDPLDKSQTCVKLTVQLLDNEDEQRAQFPVFVRGNKPLIDIMGPSGSTLPPQESQRANNQRLRDSIEKPKGAHISGNLVSSDEDSPYAVEVLVRPYSGAPAVARLPKIQDGQVFVDIKKGEVYEVRLHNRSKLDAAVTLTIDGLSVFTFSDVRDEKERPKYHSYIVFKGTQWTIPGWHKTNEEALELLVSEYGKGASALAPSRARAGSVGVLTLTFAQASDKPLSSGSTIASAPRAETGRGKDVKTDLKEVRLDVGPVRSVVSIRYAR